MGGKVNFDSNSMPQNCVVEISDVQILIKNLAIDANIVSLGARKAGDIWAIQYNGRAELLKRIEQLRTMEFVFVGSPGGWPPSEVVAELREQNLFSGAFREALHLGSGKWHIHLR